MAWKINISKSQPPWRPAFRVSGALLAGSVLIYFGLHELRRPQTGPMAHTASINQQSSADPFDFATPPMQPLSSPAPRHLSPVIDSDNVPPLPSVQPDSTLSDPLRTETLDMQKRLQIFRLQWKDEQSTGREKFFRGELPVQDLESEQRVVDQRFAAAYAERFASEALAERAKLLQAVPGLSSHQDYERVQTVQQLMDIERDFTELRTAYSRR